MRHRVRFTKAYIRSRTERRLCPRQNLVENIMVGYNRRVVIKYGSNKDDEKELRREKRPDNGEAKYQQHPTALF